MTIISCAPGNSPITQDACERLKSESSCRDRGCTWDGRFYRSIEVDGQCSAFNRLDSICLAASESVNNVTMDIYRKVDSGTELAHLSNGYEWVLGWMGLNQYIVSYGPWACGPEPAACEAQTDRAGCDRLYCYWAQDVRVGIVEGDACTGWEPDTVSMCLTPYPYLQLEDGSNPYDHNAGVQRRYVTLSTGPRVYEFSVSPYAAFHSKEDGELIYWNQCYMESSNRPAICNCDD